MAMSLRWVMNTTYMWKTSITAPMKKAYMGEGFLRLNMKMCIAAATKPARQVETLQAMRV